MFRTGPTSGPTGSAEPFPRSSAVPSVPVVTTFRAPTPSGDLVGTVTGSGPELLLLHGGPGLSPDYLDDLVAELAGGWTVATYQQRGLEPSAVDGDVTVPGHVADVLAVLDHLGWERPVLGGHSWGGLLAMHVLADHPDRWRGALVVDPQGAVGDGGDAEFLANLSARVPEENRSRVDELDALEAERALTPEEFAEQVTLMWPAYHPDPSAAPPAPEMVVSDRAAEMFESMFATLPALEARLTGCAVPAVFVHGALSPMPVTASTDSAALMAAAEVVVVDGAGHFVWMDEPGAVRRALDARLA